MDNAEQMFGSLGKKTKPNQGLPGIANKAPMAPTNSRTMPGIFPGGSDEGISFDGNGTMQVGKRTGRPFKSSESQTSTFEDFQKGKKSRDPLSQQ